MNTLTFRLNMHYIYNTHIWAIENLYVVKQGQLEYLKYDNFTSLLQRFALKCPLSPSKLNPLDCL